MPQHLDTEIESDTTVLEERAPPPSLYQVILLNDDFTPMEFVIDILCLVFAKDHASAQQIMLQIHHQGRGVCGVFAYDIAHTKMTEVLKLAHEAEHPLQCLLEKI